MRPLTRHCTYGIDDECFRDEDCVLANSRTRHGLCECVDGYARNLDLGWCEPKEDKTSITHEQNRSEDKV